MEEQPTLENKMRVFRMMRNGMLRLCDWTQLPNAHGLTQDDKNAWESYRQQLRDLPLNVNIDNIVWPTPPGPLDNGTI